MVGIRNHSVLARQLAEREHARKKLGGNVRRERCARAMSQARLAALAGLNVRTIAKIEAGEVNLRAETLAQLRQALGCPMSSLTDTPSQRGKR
jgi:transcriptional regulator with XRE-family HTH domain